VNWGGWLLLTVLFSGLMLIVQRAERKRRRVTFIIMALVGALVWRYALYRIGGLCDLSSWSTLCATLPLRQKADAIAEVTAIWSVIGAIVVNFLFWAFFGRYNPVGSSDSIKVYGLDME